jgi:hypothetical protein
MSITKYFNCCLYFGLLILLLIVPSAKSFDIGDLNFGYYWNFAKSKFSQGADEIGSLIGHISDKAQN